MLSNARILFGLPSLRASCGYPLLRRSERESELCCSSLSHICMQLQRNLSCDRKRKQKHPRSFGNKAEYSSMMRFIQSDLYCAAWPLITTNSIVTSCRREEAGTNQTYRNKRVKSIGARWQNILGVFVIKLRERCTTFQVRTKPGRRPGFYHKT